MKNGKKYFKKALGIVVVLSILLGAAVICFAEGFEDEFNTLDSNWNITTNSRPSVSNGFLCLSPDSGPMQVTRTFTGDKWTFESKIEYDTTVTPPSGGYYLSASTIQFGIETGFVITIIRYRGNGARFNPYMGDNSLGVYYTVYRGPIYSTPLSFDTKYFRVIRNGYDFTFMSSVDGEQYVTNFTTTTNSSYVTSNQKIVLTCTSSSMACWLKSKIRL